MTTDDHATFRVAESLQWLVDCVRTGLDGLDQPVTIVDTQGRFVYYNHASALLDGIDPQQMIGCHVLEITPWLDADDSTLLRCLRERVPLVDAYQAYHGAGGQPVHYLHRAFPLLDRDGELIGAMEVGRTVSEMPSDGAARHTPPPDILTRDPAMQRQLAALDIFAVTDLPLLIHGETGTGKELFARRAHAMSRRGARPMISLNCAAIPETLLESTLFGTTRGAFTGAENRKGMFALADGGTLFLDEINSMPQSLQSKLLRVLQDGSYLPLGSQLAQHANVRLIAALNQRPREAIADGRLREDLYYRLNVGCLHIPPLRERRDDIALLAHAFVRRDAAELNPNVTALGDAALAQLQRLPWPGNVRELENAIRRSLLLHGGQGAVLERISLPDDGESPALPPVLPVDGDLHHRLEEAERQWIAQALATHGGNAARAAAALGLPRTTLIGRMQRLGLQA